MIDQSDITSFSGENSFLSNFHPCIVYITNLSFPTVEHAYQWSKCIDLFQRETIRLATTPGLAKRLGRKCNLDPKWDEKKLNVMTTLLWKKFSQPEFKELLLATGNCQLIEGNNWHDLFWGCELRGNIWVGENHLGSILMDIRNHLRGW